MIIGRLIFSYDKGTFGQYSFYIDIISIPKIAVGLYNCLRCLVFGS